MMSFHFNPSFWFVCKSCRETFSDTDTFKAHKLECHLGESLNIKCIVFEEKLLEHEWVPPTGDNNKISNIKKLNKRILEPSKTSPAPQENREGSSLNKIQFRNPYVSLEVLSKKGLVSKINKNLSNQPTDPMPDPGPDPCHGPGSSRIPFLRGKSIAKRNQPILKRIHKKSITVVTNPSSPPKFYLKLNLDGGETTSDEDNPTDFGSAIKIETEEELLEETFTDFESQPQNIESDYDSRGNGLDVDVNNASTNEDLKVVANTNGDSVDSDSVAEAATSPVKRKRRPRPKKPRLPKPKKKPSRSFNCHICGLCSVSNYHLQTHMATHANPKRFNCPFCDAAFKSGPTLQHHLIIHGKSTRYTCRFCDKSFSSNRDLVGHESCHTGACPFKCHVGTCPLAFRTKSSLFLHTRVVHREELGLPHFLCVTCGLTFGLASILKRHRQKHHPLQVGDVSPSPSTAAQ